MISGLVCDFVVVMAMTCYRYRDQPRVTSASVVRHSARLSADLNMGRTAVELRTDSGSDGETATAEKLTEDPTEDLMEEPTEEPTSKTTEKPTGELVEKRGTVDEPTPETDEPTPETDEPIKRNPSDSGTDTAVTPGKGKSARRKRKRKGPAMPPDIAADRQLHKYWLQRYRLFSRFDEGIKLDRGTRLM